MTAAEILALRNKYYTALLELDVTLTTFSVDGESYQHDAHRESLMKAFEYYNDLYLAKTSGIVSKRQNVKAIR